MRKIQDSSAKETISLIQLVCSGTMGVFLNVDTESHAIQFLRVNHRLGLKKQKSREMFLLQHKRPLKSVKSEKSNRLQQE